MALRVLAGIGVAGLLAGCSNGPSWGGWSKRPSNAEVAAVLARTEGQEIAQPAIPTRKQTTSLAASER